MIHFEALRPEYTALLHRMVITRPTQVTQAAHKLIKYIDAGRYKVGCDKTGVPQIVAAASFEREASSNFNLNPAQGAPLHRKSRIIPHNGPFDTWTEAQIAAYHIDGLDKVGKDNWTWELACYNEEKFNGFGPRGHGIHTGYLWAGSNNYISGKYVKDGPDGWSPTTIDSQLGVIPMMKKIVDLRPDLDLPHPYPYGTPPAPQQIPGGSTDEIKKLQTELNSLMMADPPLDIDGNYGRLTAAAVRKFQSENHLDADGLYGPKTKGAIESRLVQA